MGMTKFYSPTALGMSGASVVAGQSPETVQIPAAQYTDFMVCVVYTGNPTTLHQLLVIVDDVIATPIVMPLVMTAFTGAVNWGAVTMWFRFGGVNVFNLTGNDPRLCSGPGPCHSWALEIVGSGAAGTATTRVWAWREDGEA